jgi:hypothetical protein
MFYAGPSGALSSLAFQNLAFDGNAQHNQLGAAHGTGGGVVGDNRNCCAIFIGGMNNGDGLSLTGLTVQNLFSNFQARRGPGARRKSDPASISGDVLISGNTFYDNRKADGNRDHSTVNIFADNACDCSRFALPANAMDLQAIDGRVELHGSASCFNPTLSQPRPFRNLLGKPSSLPPREALAMHVRHRLRLDINVGFFRLRSTLSGAVHF